MKNKFMPIMLALSLCVLPFNVSAKYTQPKDSAARRIAFFLLHGACTVGGFYFTVASAGTAVISSAIKKADPVELERIRQERVAELAQKGHNVAEIDQKSREIIESLKRPAVVPVASACAVGGAAVTIYGIQGLFKDFFSLFN